jgi:hypothetical protein
MITQALKELYDQYGFSNDTIKHIRELMEELAAESYIMGYDDRRIDEEVEREYYAGFSAYGKKEDWV